MEIGNFTEDTIISAVYFEGEKGWTMIKRFKIETSTMDQKFNFIPETSGTKLYFASMDKSPVVRCQYNAGKTKESKDVEIIDFIDVKGWKAMGNRFIDSKLIKVEKLESDDAEAEETKEINNEDKSDELKTTANKPETPLPSGRDETKTDADKPDSPNKNKPGYKPGDTIEFDF